jgi:hypothetical protein
MKDLEALSEKVDLAELNDADIEEMYQTLRGIEEEAKEEEIAELNNKI